MNFKIIYRFLLILSMFVFLVQCSKFEEYDPGIDGLQYVGQYDLGYHYKSGTGNIDVLVLEGSFRKMGRQYGHFLKTEMDTIFAIVDRKLDEMGWTGEDKEAYAKQLEMQMPQMLKELIFGMKETSNLSKVEQFLVSSYLSMQELPSSTSMSLWGEKTGKAPLMNGYNWDMKNGVLEEFKEFLTLVIYKPEGYGNSAAEITFAGSIWFQNGINNRRLMLNLQNAMYSDPTVHENREPLPYSIFPILFDYSTAPTVDVAINSIQSNSAAIINIADVNTSYSYLCATFDSYKQFDEETDMIVNTNHFEDYPSYWNIVNPVNNQQTAWTRSRKQNIEGILKEKDIVSVIDLKGFLELEISDGGASFYENDHYYTAYQSIIIPQDLTLYIKVQGLSGWESIQLKPLFDL